MASSLRLVLGHCRPSGSTASAARTWRSSSSGPLSSSSASSSSQVASWNGSTSRLAPSLSSAARCRFLLGSVHGSFHDVITNELIVQTFAPDGVADFVVLEKHRFEDLGDGRTRLTAQSLVESFEHRDSFIDAGLLEGYARLDQLLEEL